MDVVKNMPPCSHSQGFTLIELTMVIIIVAIVAVVANPRWLATSTNLNYEVRRVLNDIRYTQGLSIASGQRYRWVRLSATSYQITNEAGTAVVLPTGGTITTLSSGATFGSFTNLGNNLIAFDSQGTPYIDSSYPGTALAGTAIIPLTAGGVTRSVQISPQTGYGVLG